MKSLLLILSLVSVCACGRAQSPGAPAPSDERVIRSVRSVSNQAIAAGDLRNIAISLDRDFVAVTGNGTELTREAYLAAFSKDFEDPHSLRFERIVDAIDISTALPMAAERGHWIGRVTGGPALVTGTYLAQWRKTEHGWRIRAELFVVLACSDADACAAYRKKYETAK